MARAVGTCRKCGAENQPDAQFCISCGERLSGAVGAPVVPAPAPAEPPRDLTAGTPVPQPPDEPPRMVSRGRAFGVGMSTDHYLVWDLRRGRERAVVGFDRSTPGWEGAWQTYQALEDEVPPAWRSAGAGWILLHILIGGVGLAFLQGLILGILAAIAAGPVPDEPPALAGVGLTLVGFTGLVGWILFVYLRRSLTIRWVVFLSVLLGGFLVGAILALSSV